MKVRFESDDGMVSGYGDEGKAAVEAHESDPLARFLLPWGWDGKLMLLLNRDGFSVPGEQFRTITILGSRLAPLVQDLVKAANEMWSPEWRTYKNGDRRNLVAVVVALENAMNEVLNG